jgi:hypothetical protein
MQSQLATVRSWVREILALGPASEVEVEERQAREVCIVVTREGKRSTHVIAAPLNSLTWAVTAGALLHMGKSCAEHDHGESGERT